MIRFFLKRIVPVVILLSPVVALGRSEQVEYDRGNKKELRHFQLAETCTHTPCILTERGAIRIPKKIAQTHRIEIGYLHRGLFYSISLFQESTSLEQKLSERVFTRKPNRKIVNLERKVEKGAAETLYMYGILLQYEFDEGDLLAVKLTSLKDPTQVQEYFFRYHHAGLNWDADLAFIQPLNIFHPNPGGVIQAAYSTGALSFSVAKSLDPERDYSLFSKALHSVRANLFLGLLLRRDITTFNGDRITGDEIDGFGGLGLTFLDFLALGYGGNFVRSPHTTFPFIGIEIRHLMEFLRTLKKDTHSRWEKYLKEEMEKKSD